MFVRTNKNIVICRGLPTRSYNTDITSDTYVSSHPIYNILYRIRERAFPTSVPGNRA
jgi:hypothetical protein